MSVRAGLKKLSECLGKNMHKVIEAIMKADLGGLIKLGVLAGVTIGTIVLIFKFLRDKKKSYHDEKGKDPVDKTLDLNYHDLHQQDKLHPMMKKVRKTLEKDLKPRRRKGGKRKSSYKKNLIRRYSEDARERKSCNTRRGGFRQYDDDYDVEADNADANAQIKEFLDNQDMYREDYPNDDDHGALHRVWEDTNYSY